MDSPREIPASPSSSPLEEGSVAVGSAVRPSREKSGGDGTAAKPSLVWKNLPKALGPYADRLATCLEEGGDPLPVIAELCTQSLQQPSDLLDATGSLLSGWFDGQAATLAIGVPPEYLAAELSLGSPILTAIIVRHWRETSQIARLEQVADAAGTAPDLLCGAETGRTLCKIAEGIALWKPLRAQRLIALANPLLTGTEDADAIQHAADWKKAGELLKRLDAPARDFWRTTLVNSLTQTNPASEAPPEMVAELKTALNGFAGAPRLLARFLDSPAVLREADSMPPPIAEADENVEASRKEEPENDATPPAKDASTASTQSDATTTDETDEVAASSESEHPDAETEVESIDRTDPPAVEAAAADDPSQLAEETTDEPSSPTVEPIAKSGDESSDGDAEPVAKADADATEDASADPGGSRQNDEQEELNPSTSDGKRSAERKNEGDPGDGPAAAWSFVRSTGSTATPQTSTSTTDVPENASAVSPTTVEAAESEPLRPTPPRWNAAMSNPEAAAARRTPGVLIGLLTCIALAIGGLAVWRQKLHPTSASASTATSLVMPAAGTEAGVGAVPVSTASAQERTTEISPPEGPGATTTLVTAIPANSLEKVSTPPPATIAPPSITPPQEVSSTPAAPPSSPPESLSMPSVAVTAPRPPTAEDKERHQLKTEVLEQNPGVARWHQRIVGERYEKVQALLMGRETYLPSQAPEYAALLKTLLLDPPTDATSREVACKQAIRRLSPREIVPIFEKTVYRGSPNAPEVREACSLLLELRREALGPSMAARVEALIAKSIE